MLVYGDMGVWKSCNALDIARRIDTKMFVVDTDNAWQILLERMAPNLRNVEVFDCLTDWEDIERAIIKSFKNAGPDDWVVLDSTSDMWDQCIDYYTKLLCGQNLPQFLLDYRKKWGETKADKAGVQGSLVELGLYDYVNPAWRNAVGNRAKTTNCHLYMTSQGGDTGNPREDKLTKQTYGLFGKKPRTQKGLGFSAATVLLLDRDKMGRVTYSVVKDWGKSGKELERDVRYESFVDDYLTKVAGWTNTAS